MFTSLIVKGRLGPGIFAKGWFGTWPTTIEVSTLEVVGLSNVLCTSPSLKNIKLNDSSLFNILNMTTKLKYITLKE